MEDLSHRQLIALLTIADKQNISRAADELSLSQPSLSRALGRLEKRLGARLFERSSRGVHPTEVGLRVCSYAKEIVNAHESIKQCVTDLKGTLAGTVCIALPESVGSFLSIHLIEHFRKHHPNVRLRILFSKTSTIPHYLNSSIADVAVVDDFGLKNLVVLPLMSEEFYLISAADGVISAGNSATMQEVAKLPLVLPALEGSIRSSIEPAFAHRGLRPNVTMEVDSLAAILDMVTDGYGHSILPYSMAHRSVLRNEVVARSLTDNPIERTFWTGLPSNRPLSVLIRSVENELRVVAHAHGKVARWKPKSSHDQGITPMA